MHPLPTRAICTSYLSNQDSTNLPPLHAYTIMGTLTTNTATASYVTSSFSQRMGWGERPALQLIAILTAYWIATLPLSLLNNATAVAYDENMFEVDARYSDATWEEETVAKLKAGWT